MNDDADRWVKGEGPEPEGIRELLDAAFGPSEMTPEQKERLDRRFYAALAQKQAERARRRRIMRVSTGAAAALALAAAVALVLRSKAPSDADDVAVKPAPTGQGRARELPKLDPGPSGDKGPSGSCAFGAVSCAPGAVPVCLLALGLGLAARRRGRARSPCP